MARKSKQAGGHNPLTYYERTKKFASSEYGTTQQRLAGHSQYQLGDCALSLTSLAVCGGTTAAAVSAAAASTTNITTTTTTALCSPSGYLYSEDAILEYLLTKTRELKDQQATYERQQALQEQAKMNEKTAAVNKRKADFIDLHHSQKQKKATTSSTGKQQEQPARLMTQEAATAQAQDGLKHASYWLAESQPKAVTDLTIVQQQPPAADLRPPSPHSQQPLRRKDLWPVSLQWTASTSTDNNNNKTSSTATAPPQLVCSVSGKVLHTQSVTAYWTTDSYKKMTTTTATAASSSSSSQHQHHQHHHGPGKLVLTSVYDQVIKKSDHIPKCPETNRKIKATRVLQKSGSSFAASGQACQVKQYRPTIT